MEIDTPHSLVSLPRPIDSVNGRIQASCVSSLAGSRKRKRAEIAVGIDGEGINIYNIKNARLLASYALSPQTYFAAAPCSVYRRRQPNRPATRVTYAAVTAHGVSQKPQIISFAEEVQSQTHGGALSPSSFDVQMTSKIKSLDVLKSASGPTELLTDAAKVVSVYEDGTVLCLSGVDLTKLWESKLGDLLRGLDQRANSSLHVEFAVCVETSAATDGILRSREDLKALLDASHGTAEGGTKTDGVLCVVTKATAESGSEEYELHLISIPSQADPVATASGLRHLETWSLPQTSRAQSPTKESTFSLHPRSGTLYQLASGAVVTYNLSGVTPAVTSQLELDQPVQSFTRVTKSLLLIATAKTAGVFDVKYHSCLGSTPLGQYSQTIPTEKKRKRSQSQKALQVLGFFPAMNLAIGLHHHEIIGIQAAGGTTSAGTYPELMIDSVGRGIADSWQRNADTHMLKDDPRNLFIQHIVSGADPRWIEAKMKLVKYRKTNNITKFERHFSIALATAMRPSMSKSKKKRPRGSGRGIASTPADRTKAFFAIQCIFEKRLITGSAESSTESMGHPSSIAISFFPPNVFRWLAETSQLRADVVQRALDQQEPDQLTEVTPADVIASIINHDPKLHLLSDVLATSSHLPLAESVQALRFLISATQITQGGASPSVASSEAPRVNGHSSEHTSSALVQQIDAATTDLDNVVSLLNSDIPIIGRSLRHVLTRLFASFPVPAISAALRNNLARHELTALLELLRLELFNGGWTTRYEDDMAAYESDSEDGEPSDRSAIITATLISAVLDAIGLAGWLVAVPKPSSSLNVEFSGADDHDQLLSSLRTDVSAALEGVSEASYLVGLLEEFNLYHARVQRKAKSDLKNRKRSKYDKRPPVKVVAAASASTNADGMDDGENHDDAVAEQDVEMSMLPIGLKVEVPVLRATRADISGSGHRVKSQRERGLETSKAVDKYSFERIRF